MFTIPLINMANWPKGKKEYFIRYFETSKSCVFIGLQDSGSVTEFESRDVTSLIPYS